jgi:predicted HTH transcriptional regulator
VTNEAFGEILALGYERRNTEFKGPGARSSQPLFARLIRAVLGMANQQDGGLVVIGVADVAGLLDPVGLTPEDLATWRYDDVAAGIAPFADPFVSFDLEVREYDAKQFIVLQVREFDEIPVVCRRDYLDILRPGACYVRSRRKPETSEIPSQTEMRELLALATTKGLRKFVGQAIAVGLLSVASPLQLQSDAELYDKELGDLRHG